MEIKIICLLTSILILNSCSPIAYSHIPGEYKTSSKDSKTTITFMESGNFTFIQNNIGVIRTCTGKWELVTARKLKLKCDDQSDDLEKVLSSGYMESLNVEVLLIRKRKIKIGNLVLKRITK
ncbi:hypothetical protein N9L92_03080 [Saprospiraceae bacterium]|nr:hypothetical protein [Saprospiraceae bacterium]